MTVEKNKLIRITTVPISLDKLLHGQLAFMNQSYEVVAVSSNQFELDRVGAREGVRTFCIEMTRKITPIKDLSCLWKMYRFLRKERPLIVHSHTPKAGTIGMTAAFLARVPCRLHTVAGLPLMETQGMKRAVLNLVEKLTYFCATKVYPNSTGLLEFIKQQGLTKDGKLHIIGNGSSNGIDTTWFNPSQIPIDLRLRFNLGISSNDFIFVFVGRLVTDKGINELVSAFMELYDRGNEVRLLLVGQFEDHLDPLQNDTLNRISTCSAIHSVGYQEDVRPYLLISDAMVFPSYREGFPNVVMQAGAMGLPVIATDINGCNEIIQDGVNGLLVPVKDTLALLKAMHCLINDESLRYRLAAKSRSMIVERYEQRVIWDALLEAYRAETKQLLQCT